jgi:hypothetical protein
MFALAVTAAVRPITAVAALRWAISGPILRSSPVQVGATATRAPGGSSTGGFFPAGIAASALRGAIARGIGGPSGSIVRRIVFAHERSPSGRSDVEVEGMVAVSTISSGCTRSIAIVVKRSQSWPKYAKGEVTCDDRK